MIDISELTTLKSKSKLQSDKCQSLGLKQCSSKLVIRLIKYIMKQNFLYIIETFKDSQEISAMVHMQMKHSHSNAILSVNTWNFFWNKGIFIFYRLHKGNESNINWVRNDPFTVTNEIKRVHLVSVFMTQSYCNAVRLLSAYVNKTLIWPK